MEFLPPSFCLEQEVVVEKDMSFQCGTDRMGTEFLVKLTAPQQTEDVEASDPDEIVAFEEDEDEE